MENRAGRIFDDPRKLPYQFIKTITNELKNELGSGSFGTVYKGLLEDGEAVAVKVFHYNLRPEISDQQFQNEFENLKRLKHPNIVRLVGFCYETEDEPIEYKGNIVVGKRIHRALCLEYVPNGSLHKLLSDECLGSNWPIRYKIIKGICNGLKYLHEGLDVPILHFDLKPDNILLDEKMVPKIADFGLSRLIGEGNTTMKTRSCLGTVGYLPPEFIEYQAISKAYDIYSLGVIIAQIITGITGYYDIADMGAQKFIDHVHENWKRSLQDIPNYESLEVDCKQVKICVEIAINCMQKERRKRPTIKNIVTKLLDETGSVEEDSHFEMKKDGGNKEPVILSNSIPGPYQAKMAGAILIAVVKIDSIIEDAAANATINKLSVEVPNLNQVPWKIKEIGMQLRIMSKLIRQIGIFSLTNEKVKTWIGEVRKVAFRVEDIMDQYSFHVLQLEQQGTLTRLMKGEHYVIVFCKIVDHVRQIEEAIQQLIQTKDQWLDPSQLLSNEQLAELERQRGPDVSFPEFVKDDLVGIEENRKLLTAWIYSEEQASTVITVSGMGGLGKSSLVTDIYERQKVNFPVHAWIVVSQICTVEFLLRKLLWKIGHTEPPVPREIDKMDVHDLKEEVKRKLQNRKCLIVLDDVWEQEIYFKIHDAFQTLQGSRIIITTRKCHAGAIASFGHHLELQPLCVPDAFELFCRRAFHSKDHKCPEELQEIAGEIVKRCHGLPLAIVSIGSLLSTKQVTEDVWKAAYNQLESQLTTYDYLRAILNLSYHDLSGDLQLCFSYCSLLSEDYPMSRETLVRLWVAEGFVLSKEKNTPEEVAEGNLMELIHRNMLKVVDYDELGRVSTCQMHDIMRDLALSVAKEEKFGSANDYGGLVQVDKNVRRLSLCAWNVNTAPNVEFPRLRTLVAHGIISSSLDIVSSIMSESSYLTVLELQDSEITEVPAFIGNLFNLRYIGLRHTKVKSLPESIETLFNLHTLDIRQTQIEKLPRGIVKVKRLRHLLADRFADEQQSYRYFMGVEAPKGPLNLEELQTLETVQASKDLAEQLKKLMQIRSISIDNVSAADCANLFESLSAVPHLSSLLISARDENETLCLQALAPISPKLHKLIVRGLWADETLEYPIFCNHGKHLKYLALSWCQLGEDPLGVLAPHVPNLTYLSLNRVKSASTLVLSEGCFPHLKTCVLQRMPNVKKLEIGHGALPCIEGLYLISLPQLDKVPQGIEPLRSLKKLWLMNLNREFRTEWLTNVMQLKMLHVAEIRF